MFNERFSHLADTIKDLGKSCEQLGIQHTTKLSSLEVTVSQQAIQLKKLEEQIALDKVNAQDYARTIVDLEDKLVKAQKDCGKAQEIVSDNVDTIVRLQRDYKELEDILNYEHDLGLHGVSDLQELNASLVDQCGILQEKNNSLHEMVNAFKGITPYATNMRVIRKADGTIPIDIHSGVVEQEDNPFPGSFVPVRTIPTDEYSVYLASGRGMQQYPVHPDDSTLLDWPWGKPEPYPYTHPIREIPDYSRVKVK